MAKISRELLFISRLSSYTLKASATRILLVGATASIFLLVASALADAPLQGISLAQYARVVVLFIVISEGNALLDNLSERFLPIPQRIGLRIGLHIMVSIAIAWLAFVYFERLVGLDLLKERTVQQMIAMGLIFVLITIIASIAIRITEKWISSLHELETLKQAKLQSDYNALQEQLNPHFLFNNLSVLKSMVIYNPERAVEFIDHFTDVYRYVLHCRDKTLVSLAEELEHIKSYMGIHLERLGPGLVASYSIDSAQLSKKVPALALQTLVENAIKHNIASQSAPLRIAIAAEGNRVVVENNYQPREASYTTQQGLKNLEQRYMILTKRGISVVKSSATFRVEIPLV